MKIFTKFFKNKNRYSKFSEKFVEQNDIFGNLEKQYDYLSLHEKVKSGIDLGKNYIKRNDIRKSNYFYNQAYKYGKDLGEPNSCLESCFGLMKTYDLLGNEEEVQNFEKIIENLMSQEEINAEILAKVQLDLANLYKKRKETDKSKVFFEKLDKNKVLDESDKIEMYLDYGEILFLEKNYSKAQEVFKKGWLLCHKCKKLENEHYFLYYMAGIVLQKDKLKGIEKLQEILKILGLGPNFRLNCKNKIIQEGKLGIENYLKIIETLDQNEKKIESYDEILQCLKIMDSIKHKKDELIEIAVKVLEQARKDKVIHEREIEIYTK